MFDIDAGKLLILGVIALVVLGPKELPRVMRQVGSALGKMRRMAAEFQTQFMDAVKESEMEELRKDMQKMADQTRVDIDYNPVTETDRQIRDAIDGKPTENKSTENKSTENKSGDGEFRDGWREPDDFASTPVPEDPDPDNRVYSADIPRADIAQAREPAGAQPAEDAAMQPVRKTGEA